MTITSPVDGGLRRLDLTPRTAAGAQFLRLADQHASDAAVRAGELDRTASFPRETFEEMQASGFLAACLPEALGGLGITATTDLAAGFCRLASADAGLALAANMHCLTGLGIGRLWSGAESDGGVLPGWLRDLACGMAEGRHAVCVAGTEPGQTLGWFETVGSPVDGGYLVSGRKAFASGSPAATHLYVMLRVPGRGGDWMNAVAIVERERKGIEVCEDWDPLGMRTSGSNSVVFDRCFIERERVVPVGPPLQLSRFWIRFFVEGNVSLLAVFVGIAEAAERLTLDALAARRDVVTGEPISARTGIQRTVADLARHVFVARAAIERIAGLVDEFYAEDAADPLPLAEHHVLMAEFQSAKLTVNHEAIAAVDAAMTAVGGSSYGAGSALARLYRDARAGPFMQAFSPNEASEYLGRVRLGYDPVPLGR